MNNYKINVKEENYKEYKRVLINIDMNNGFVNFGNMANPEYNKLVPNQLKAINKIRENNDLLIFVLEGHEENSTEFNKYPKHCVLGTKEADLIKEFIDEQDKDNTCIFYKNCINGMFNIKLQEIIKKLENVKEFIVEGVCTDLCVLDFTLSLSRYLDQINKNAKIYVVRDSIDTFSSPEHNKEEWTNITEKVLTQAGVIFINNIEELDR